MKTYTKREISHLLSVSPGTVAEDYKFLNLKPTEGDRGSKLFSKSDFDLICQLREHCKDKRNTRDSFVPNTIVEVLDEEPKVVSLGGRISKNPDTGLDTYPKGLAGASHESINYGLRTDPLFDLDLLQRISDRNYLLPTNRLAPILDLSPKYLSSKREYCYCGFVATKEIYAHGKALWKITANNS